MAAHGRHNIVSTNIYTMNPEKRHLFIFPRLAFPSLQITSKQTIIYNVYMKRENQTENVKASWASVSIVNDQSRHNAYKRRKGWPFLHSHFNGVVILYLGSSFSSRRLVNAVDAALDPCHAPRHNVRSRRPADGVGIALVVRPRHAHDPAPYPGLFRVPFLVVLPSKC
ncbi:hypothetical protein ACRALDRAFT_206993 [Sodiomyces alcalophilus JCM 7366]|uniref:uncharacterized protein n=1 Tax=Sodiomyces alcalophilus JCM 7366 TaxID=591952 RepID=UPI0039B3BCEA